MVKRLPQRGEVLAFARVGRFGFGQLDPIYELVEQGACCAGAFGASSKHVHRLSERDNSASIRSISANQTQQVTRERLTFRQLLALNRSGHRVSDNLAGLRDGPAHLERRTQYLWLVIHLESVLCVENHVPVGLEHGLHVVPASASQSRQVDPGRDTVSAAIQGAGQSDPVTQYPVARKVNSETPSNAGRAIARRTSPTGAGKDHIWPSAPSK
jgi:hypothetical protein